MYSDTTVNGVITLESGDTYAKEFTTFYGGTIDRSSPEEDDSEFKKYLMQNTKSIVCRDDVKKRIEKFEEKYGIKSSELEGSIKSGKIKDTYETSYWRALVDLVK